MQNQKIPVPSTSCFRFNFICAVFFFVCLIFIKLYFPLIGAIELVTLGMLLTACLMFIDDIFNRKVYCRVSSGILNHAGPFNSERLVIKLIGLYGTFIIILIAYYLNPYYWNSPRAIEFYGKFFALLTWASPWIVISTFCYFLFIDRRQRDPLDGYWHMGCLLTGRFSKINRVILSEHGRVWFIKAFFLPFMFSLLVEYCHGLLSFPWGNSKLSFFSIHCQLLDLFYAVDVLFGVLGYIFTIRVLDTHIQSTETTLLGWFVCLACYFPFSTFWGIKLLQYEGLFHWENWFAFSPVIYYFWGSTIILTSLIYGLSTVAFGYRMSNLTFRGIITSGPYRYTKHPAYLCKVLSWWMISLPFYSIDGSWCAITHTLSLTVISIIYYFRAKTEENHLTNYPEYIAYAEWINDHGLFAPIKRIFPSLKYSAEKARKWQSKVWFNEI